MTFLSAIPKIVIGVIIAGLLASTIFYRWESAKKDDAIIADKATIATENAANKEMQKTVQHLVVLRQDDEISFETMLHNQDAILKQQTDTNSAIAKLRITDAQVDKYLREPIPVALRNIINGLRDKASDADCRNKDSRCHAAKAVH